MDELDRLEHVRGLLDSDTAPTPPRLLLFSRSGFTPSLRGRARKASDVELVDLKRLYHGS